MQSIVTFHATCSPLDAFTDGFWPLTHFGDPKAGLRQIGRKMRKLMNHGQPLPREAYVIPVNLFYVEIQEFEDWGSVNFLGLLDPLIKKEHLTPDEAQRWRMKGIDERGDGVGLNRGTMNQTNADFCAFMRRKGYDLIKYSTIGEMDAWDLLPHIDLGNAKPDPICYSITSTAQAQISGAPEVIPIDLLSPAFRI